MKYIRLFYVLGISAVIVGGMVSAFMARDASYVSSWAVAYTVLVLGVAQVGIGEGVRRFRSKAANNTPIIWALLTFNIGGIAVLVGTMAKSLTVYATTVVDIGCLMVITALILTVIIISGSRASTPKTIFYILLFGLIASSVVGLVLSNLPA